MLTKLSFPWIFQCEYNIQCQRLASICWWAWVEDDSFSRGGANEDISSIHSSPNETTFDIAGPITRSRAKQLEKEIHSQVNANLMLNNQIMLNGPMLLSTCFNVLRNDGVHEQAWDEDGFCPPNISKEPGRAREREKNIQLPWITVVGVQANISEVRNACSQQPGWYPHTFQHACRRMLTIHASH